MPNATEEQRKADLERRQRGAEMAAEDDAPDDLAGAVESGPPDPEGEEPRTGPRISPIEGFFMLAVALMLYLAQAALDIIFIGFIVAGFAWLVFYVWFYWKGMGFNKKLMDAIKKGDAMSMGKNPAVINAVTALIGMTPLGALPELPLGIFIIILIEYADFYMGKFGIASFTKKVPAQ